MADFPRKAYFRDQYGRVEAYDLVGETSRSWLWGSAWKPYKIAKKGLTEISESEFRTAQWVEHNAYAIGARVMSLRDYDTLRKVAELVGFQEVQRG